MDFGAALSSLKRDEFVSRKGWNGKGQWLRLMKPDAYSVMTSPYIFICTVDGKYVPWVASQGDILAEDWVIVLAPGAKLKPEPTTKIRPGQIRLISKEEADRGENC